MIRPTNETEHVDLIVATPAPPPVVDSVEMDRPSTIVTMDPTLARALNNRWVVMGILATTGPIGLPALWLSGRFSQATKVLTTILFLIVTVVFPLAMTYYWVEVAMRPLLDAMSDALEKTKK